MSDDTSHLSSKLPGLAGVGLMALDHTFLWVNPALCKLLGYSVTDLIGRPVEEITHPDDLKLDSHLARRLFRGELDRYEIDKRYLSKSGTSVTAHLTASAIRDSSGAVLYGLALIELPQIGGPMLADVKHRALGDIRSAGYSMLARIDC